MAETTGQMLDRRIRELNGWMFENAPYCEGDQKHLDAETSERAYWRYGYLVALRDIAAAIRARSDQ